MIHRGGGASIERLDVCTVVGVARGADASAYDEAPAGDVRGFAQGADDGARRGRRVTRACVKEYDRELVATGAHNEISLARRRPQPVRDALEEQIARGMPQGIVDPLEMVEVEGQDGSSGVRGPAGADGLENLLELHAVRQPGQRVVPSVELELLVRDLALRDVDDGPDETYRLPREIVLAFGSHLPPAYRLVAAHGSIFDALPAAGVDDVFEHRQDPFLIVGVCMAADRLSAVSGARAGRNRHARQRKELVRPGCVAGGEFYAKMPQIHEAVYARVRAERFALFAFRLDTLRNVGREQHRNRCAVPHKIEDRLVDVDLGIVLTTMCSRARPAAVGFGARDRGDAPGGTEFLGGEPDELGARVAVATNRRRVHCDATPGLGVEDEHGIQVSREGSPTWRVPAARRGRVGHCVL